MDCSGTADRRVWRPSERPMEDRQISARIAESSSTESKQIVQRQRLALLVFLEGFPRHAADHIALLDEAALPGFFVGQRRQNLRCNRILLFRREGGDLFERFL